MNTPEESIKKTYKENRFFFSFLHREMFKLSSLWVFKYKRLFACCRGQWTAETRIRGKGLRLQQELWLHPRLPHPEGCQAPGEEKEFLESYSNTDTVASWGEQLSEGGSLWVPPPLWCLGAVGRQRSPQSWTWTWRGAIL